MNKTVARIILRRRLRDFPFGKNRKLAVSLITKIGKFAERRRRPEMKCQTIRPVLEPVPGCTHRLTDKQAIAYGQDVADLRRNWRALSPRAVERIVHILDAAHKCQRRPGGVS